MTKLEKAARAKLDGLADEIVEAMQPTVCQRVERACNDTCTWLGEVYDDCQEFVVDTYNSIPTYRIVKK